MIESMGGRAEDDCPTEEVVGLLFQLVGRLRCYFEDRASELDLSPQQAVALLNLHEALTMRRLAGLMRCDASNVTGIVDRLELRGLVERKALAGDRRVKYLTLTREGKELRSRLHLCLFINHPLLAGLEPAERAGLREMLWRILGGSSQVSRDTADYPR
ncbi:MAG: MarR family winged helix-turn-helix transcriptional regulator [Actinomycetota bacterium]